MEFSDVGKRCYHCNTQDYLPIQCPTCQQWFCSAHSLYEKHGCRIIQKKYTKKKEKLMKCSVCKTKMREYRFIICKGCNKRLCLEHRYKNKHKCTSNTKYTQSKKDNPKKDNPKKVCIIT